MSNRMPAERPAVRKLPDCKIEYCWYRSGLHCCRKLVGYTVEPLARTAVGCKLERLMKPERLRPYTAGCNRM